MTLLSTIENLCEIEFAGGMFTARFRSGSFLTDDDIDEMKKAWAHIPGASGDWDPKDRSLLRVEILMAEPIDIIKLVKNLVAIRPVGNVWVDCTFSPDILPELEASDAFISDVYDDSSDESWDAEICFNLDDK
jgi:hypothetical protein